MSKNLFIGDDEIIVPKENAKDITVKKPFLIGTSIFAVVAVLLCVLGFFYRPSFRLKGTLDGTSVGPTSLKSDVSISVIHCDRRCADVVIQNDSAYQAKVTPDPTIRAFKDERWFFVNSDKYETPIPVFVDPGDEVTIHVDWTEKYGKLRKGHYVLGLEFQIFEPNTDPSSAVRADAEFTIE